MAQGIFSHTGDAKKAAGRALGTLIELITFYMLRDWGLETDMAIEIGLPEYGNAKVTHNVEFTLHPTMDLGSVELASIPGKNAVPVRHVLAELRKSGRINPDFMERKSTQIRDSKGILRHAIRLGECSTGQRVVAYFIGNENTFRISMHDLHPYAMFECK